MSHPAKLLSFPQSAPAAVPAALLLSDPRSLPMLQQLERIAPSDATVLIVGETGTGKELAARHIHQHSRVSGAFVAVNCGAFSDGLVEAELFGHEAGAFTGAQQARAGWFEVANGGTLFLDEIGDMPLHLQVKLLRVLQERQIVRIGSRKPINVDVRLIAATHIELESAVEAQKFRRDLYYRLNVAAVRLLPLRERRGDILPLARHFIDVYSRKMGIAHARLSAAAEQALLHYSWPGNIRELENIVHVGVIMSHGGLIDVHDLRLPYDVGGAAANTVDTRVAATQVSRGTGISADDAIDALGEGLTRLLKSDHAAVYEEVERLLLTTAFEHCAGNQVRTAKRLGVSRNIVRAQLKRFGLLGQDGVAAAVHDDAFALA
jgi:sigma-54-specific transcriptional regulator